MLFKRCILKEYFTKENKSGYLQELYLGEYKNRFEAIQAVDKRIKSWLQKSPDFYEDNYCVKDKKSDTVIDYEITYVDLDIK